MAPRVVLAALLNYDYKNIADPEEAEDIALYDLCHDDSIDRPITGIGNEDVPTVIVDFRDRTVVWKWMTQPHKVPKLVAVWTFADYITKVTDYMIREEFEP